MIILALLLALWLIVLVVWIRATSTTVEIIQTPSKRGGVFQFPSDEA